MKDCLLLLKVLFYWWLSIGLSSPTLYAQPDYTLESTYRQLPEGQWTRLLYEQVPIYAAPAMGTGILARGGIGQPIQVLSRLDERMTRRGFSTNWYAVIYPSPTGPVEGFVWGGDLAVQILLLEGSEQFLLVGLRSIELVNRGAYEEEQLTLTLQICRLGRLLHTSSVLAVGTLYTDLQVKAWADRELQGVQQVVEVQFSDGYCGGVSATQTLFWDGTQMHEVGLLSNGFSDDRFDRSYYRYPNEHQYGPQIVLLQHEVGTYNSRRQPHYTRQEERRFRWTGKGLRPVGS